MIKISDYEIKEQLGEGGMATVYLATHKRLQREVALKVMNPEASMTKAFQKSFVAEGRTVAKLEHSNIVKIYDIDAQNGHFYMSMELLRKGSLKQRLENGKLPTSNALRVTAQIADALHFAHNYSAQESDKKGYIHRDIKPANIMFRDDGSAVLTDFGIAKMQGTTGEMTQMGYIAGTPYYMAPEQATGNQQIDHRADIYSLGIVFYEMLTGNKPFTGSNTVAITYEHVHAPIPKLTGENSAFQPMLDKALAKKPEERFDSINEFSQALYEASKTDAETLLMQPAIPVAITEKKPIWPWLLAIVIIGVGGIVGTYYYSKNTEEIRLEKLTREAEEAKLQAEERKLEAEREAEERRLEAERLAKERELELKRIAKEKEQELALKAAKQKAEEEFRKAEIARKQAELEAERLVKEKEAQEREARLRQEQVNSYIGFAGVMDQKRRIFDHSEWSEGCKEFLISRDGPYEPKESSESYYRKILAIDKNNIEAKTAIKKIENMKSLDYSNCDDFKIQEENTDEIDSLFAD